MTDETPDIQQIVRDVTKKHKERHKRGHKLCPHCGAPMEREGMDFGLRGQQREIFEIIARAGTLGIFSHEIEDRLYASREGPSTRTLSTQVFYVNQKLKPYGLRVTAGSGGGGKQASKPYKLIVLGDDDET